MNLEQWFERYENNIDKIDNDPELLKHIEEEWLNILKKIWHIDEDTTIQKIFLSNWWGTYHWKATEVARLYSFAVMKNLEKESNTNIWQVNTSWGNLLIRDKQWSVIDRAKNGSKIKIIDEEGIDIQWSDATAWYKYIKIEYEWKQWFVAKSFVDKNIEKNTLNGYLVKIWITPTRETKEFLYSQVDPTWHYRGTTMQNTEIFHRLIQDLELSNLVDNYETSIDQELEQLQAEVETQQTSQVERQQQTQTYQVKRGDSLSSIAREKLGDDELWQKIAEINDIPGPNYIIHVWQKLKMPKTTQDKPEETEMKEASPEELNDKITSIHEKILSDSNYTDWLKDYLQIEQINYENLPQVLSNLNGRLFWEEFDIKDTNENMKIFAQIHILSNNMLLWEYMENMWLDATDHELMENLYNKYSDSYKPYQRSTQDHLLIYRWLVIENELWRDFADLIKQAQREKIDYSRIWLDPNSIRSFEAKYSYNENQNRRISWCSKTARKNLSRLWIDYNEIRWWNANQIADEIVQNNWTKTDINWLLSYIRNEAKTNKSNVFDVYPLTDAGHRIVVFVWKDWDYYVLDPYYTSNKTEPVPIKDYKLQEFEDLRYVVWPSYSV